MIVLPVASPLFLCEEAIGYGRKVDLYGLASTIVVATNGFPHIQKRLVAFAKLVNGLGEMETRVSLIEVASGRIVRVADPQWLRFVDRATPVNVLSDLSLCHFNEPGLYVAELMCDNQIVCDTVIDVIEQEA